MGQHPRRGKTTKLSPPALATLLRSWYLALLVRLSVARYGILSILASTIARESSYGYLLTSSSTGIS